jgi:hypothetical protein
MDAGAVRVAIGALHVALSGAPLGEALRALSAAVAGGGALAAAVSEALAPRDVRRRLIALLAAAAAAPGGALRDAPGGTRAAAELLAFAAQRGPKTAAGIAIDIGAPRGPLALLRAAGSAAAAAAGAGVGGAAARLEALRTAAAVSDVLSLVATQTGRRFPLLLRLDAGADALSGVLLAAAASLETAGAEG